MEDGRNHSGYMIGKTQKNMKKVHLFGLYIAGGFFFVIETIVLMKLGIRRDRLFPILQAKRKNVPTGRPGSVPSRFGVCRAAGSGRGEGGPSNPFQAPSCRTFRGALDGFPVGGCPSGEAGRRSMA